MAGQAKLQPPRRPAAWHSELESTSCFSSTCSVPIGSCCRVGSLRGVICWGKLPTFEVKISPPLRSPKPARTPSFFRRSAELLELIGGRHALLLDIQRLDPLRRFPLRISRQETVPFVFLFDYRSGYRRSCTVAMHFWVFGNCLARCWLPVSASLCCLNLWIAAVAHFGEIVSAFDT